MPPVDGSNISTSFGESHSIWFRVNAFDGVESQQTHSVSRALWHGVRA